MKRLLAALRFLTILPIPGTWGTGADDLAASVPFFPVVGLVLGAAAAALACAMTPLASPLVTAAVLVVVLLGFSGGLHMDGLSDTADGFLSSRPRDRMLEIMKDSHTGAMGVIAIVSVMLLKFASLASLDASRLWPAALLMPLAGRSAMVVHMALLPYARDTGLATVFYQRRPRAAAIWAAGLLALVAWFACEFRGLAVWAAWAIATLLLAAYVRRKIGGATGDTFGAVCELVETVPVLTLALWPIHALR